MVLLLKDTPLERMYNQARLKEACESYWLLNTTDMILGVWDPCYYMCMYSRTSLERPPHWR